MRGALRASWIRGWRAKLLTDESNRKRGASFVFAGRSARGRTRRGHAGFPTANRAEAYFNFSMGHLYAELAASYGNRGEYLSRAIEYYKAAIKADPTAAIVSEELAGLYIQAGKVRDAVTEIEDRLNKDPNAIDARRVLAASTPA